MQRKQLLSDNADDPYDFVSFVERTQRPAPVTRIFPLKYMDEPRGYRRQLGATRYWSGYEVFAIAALAAGIAATLVLLFVPR